MVSQPERGETMPKYTMVITETVIHNINVEAQDKDTAWNDAMEIWEKADFADYVVEGDIVDIELVSDNARVKVNDNA
jgi:hypothetical protein